MSDKQQSGRRRTKANRLNRRGDRRKRRQDKPFWRGLRSVSRILGLIVFVLVCTFSWILVHDGLTQSKVFAASTVDIQGRIRLERDEILDLAGIEAGVNILSLNLRHCRERLLAHPWIQSAEIGRELPGRIEIRIKEHVAVAVIDLRQPLLLNAEGEVFKTLEASDIPVSPEGVPEISGIRSEDVFPQDDRKTLVYQSMMALLTALEETDLASQVPEILLDRDVGALLKLEGTRLTIKLGFGNYGKKLKRLKDVMAYLQKKESLAAVQTIDLNRVNRVVLEPQSENGRG